VPPTVARESTCRAVFGKAVGVLGYAELAEPIRNLLHRGPTGLPGPVSTGHILPAKARHPKGGARPPRNASLRMRTTCEMGHEQTFCCVALSDATDHQPRVAVVDAQSPLPKVLTWP
jgi:hypothetical protein